MYFLDLSKSFDSYLYGLIQTDGHFIETTRNRGCVAIELSSRDKDILLKIGEIVGGNTYCRIRNTNFKDNYESCNLRIFYNLAERKILKEIGLMPGKKSNIIKIPEKYIEADYWRGIIDGDGSLGLTKQGFCYISLVTKSASLAKAYEDFIYKITGINKLNNRNKRDNAYNILLSKENAQKIVNYLYYENCFAMQRKLNLAKIVLNWKRPLSMKQKLKSPSWSDEEINLLKNIGINNFMLQTNRTLQAVKMKIYHGIDKSY